MSDDKPKTYHFDGRVYVDGELSEGWDMASRPSESVVTFQQEFQCEWRRPTEFFYRCLRAFILYYRATEAFDRLVGRELPSGEVIMADFRSRRLSSQYAKRRAELRDLHCQRHNFKHQQTPDAKERTKTYREARKAAQNLMRQGHEEYIEQVLAEQPAEEKAEFDDLELQVANSCKDPEDDFSDFF